MFPNQDVHKQLFHLLVSSQGEYVIDDGIDYVIHGCRNIFKAADKEDSRYIDILVIMYDGYCGVLTRGRAFNRIGLIKSHYRRGITPNLLGKDSVYSRRLTIIDTCRSRLRAIFVDVNHLRTITAIRREQEQYGCHGGAHSRCKRLIHQNAYNTSQLIRHLQVLQPCMIARALVPFIH